MIVLTVLAIVIAIILGLAVAKSMYTPHYCRKHIVRLRQEIAEAERHHAPRADLRKQLVQLRCKELRS